MKPEGRQSRFERILALVQDLLAELKEEFYQVRMDSVTDSLTGLANRRALEQRLWEEMSRARRYGHELTLVMMDIDHFKQYNDIHGHRAGDEMLRRLGWVIGREVREPDVVARYGGEEFALLLPETGLKGAYSLVQRIRRRITADSRVPLTLSFGIAVFPHHADDVDTLLQAADEALYAAKQSGRDAIRDAGAVVKARSDHPAAGSGGKVRVGQPVAVGFDIDEERPVSIWIGTDLLRIKEAVIEEGSTDGVQRAYHIRTDNGYFRLVRRDDGWYLEGGVT